MKGPAAIKMRRIFLALLSGCLLLSAGGCARQQAEEPAPYEEQVTLALQALKEKWENDYYANYAADEKYLEIKNTRLFVIRDGLEIPYFEDVAYVVEFVLFSNYMRSAPLYLDVNTGDTVVIKKDGTAEVGVDILSVYMARTFSADFSGIIDEIYDYQDRYDQVIRFDDQAAGAP